MTSLCQPHLRRLGIAIPEESSARLVMAEQWPVSGLHEKSAQCATDCGVTMGSHQIHIEDILSPRYRGKAGEISSSKGTNRRKVKRKADRETKTDLGPQRWRSLVFGLLLVTEDAWGQESSCCILNDKHLSSLPRGLFPVSFSKNPSP